MAGSAPTPPPHTTLLYLEAGGSSFFSQRCQELLIKSKLNPDWFGSYKHVAALNQEARAKCDRWDNATDAEFASGMKDGTPLERPTAGDRYLSSCQSGHLVRDSNFRDEGSDDMGNDARGDPCQNVIDGYETEYAPAVPQQGMAHENLGHGRHTTRENADAQRRRNENAEMGRPEDEYRQRDRQADEDARVKKFVSEHRQRWRTSERAARNQPTGAAGTSGSGAGGSASSAGGPGGAAGSGLGTAKAPSCAPSETINGKSAVECVNNWRRKAEAQMKQRMVDNMSKHERESDVPASFAGAPPPPPLQDQYQAHLDQNTSNAVAAHTAAQGTPDAAEAARAVTRAKTRSSRFRRARCRAEQGARLRGTGGAASPRVNGRTG
ncbi:hypothetical protein MYSTI_06884 [Myxococcus stipitatus DSM 14675]|uniref:Uncharacterized protein n=1 Tax=Myxococcus stipitatus (strain DSM 14675 / JCM 12634 / Mx s8) TaxID=1278073 RepID=L7UKU3_MYXSD|nr:hypothetical protein [Myxococcus stipitatus]AGC48157.1 hypothetical protein MYSTI_06884 [Myxococcus stipitatus DSM 14675]